jgi:hypothetical protein
MNTIFPQLPNSIDQTAACRMTFPALPKGLKLIPQPSQKSKKPKSKINEQNIFLRPKNTKKRAKKEKILEE